MVPVGIATDGRWVLEADEPARLAIRGNDLPEVDAARSPVALMGATTGTDLVVTEPASVPSAIGEVDVVFPLLHGPFGEDGTVQGLLEMAGVPYVGSGVFASAASMDKAHMKSLLRAAGLPVGPYVVISDAQWRRDERGALARCEALALPLFVKPASGGSSIGISKVDDVATLRAAIEHAREHDSKVVVEQGIVGREIECGVLERVDAGGVVVAEARPSRDSGLLEPDAFYDFDSKYLDDATEVSVPADLPEATIKDVQRLALEVFEAFECAGIARVDFFLTPSGELIVNEINTMPGFTPVSMYPQMWAATGMSYPELVDRLVQAALAATPACAERSPGDHQAGTALGQVLLQHRSQLGEGAVDALGAIGHGHLHLDVRRQAEGDRGGIDPQVGELVGRNVPADAPDHAALGRRLVVGRLSRAAREDVRRISPGRAQRVVRVDRATQPPASVSGRSESTSARQVARSAPDRSGPSTCTRPGLQAASTEQALLRTRRRPGPCGGRGVVVGARVSSDVDDRAGQRAGDAVEVLHLRHHELAHSSRHLASARTITS